MTPSDLSLRLDVLYADMMTGERHSAELTGMFCQLRKAARREAEQATCEHVAGAPVQQCGKILNRESV